MDNRQVFIQRIADIQVFCGRRFCGLDIATNDPNVCFVCVILFYLILSKKRKEKIDKDCLLRYSRSRFFSFFLFWKIIN